MIGIEEIFFSIKLKAIDDFSFTPGCEINPIEQLPSNIFTTPTPDKTCTNFANAFRCKKSKECVDMSSLCNFRYDCKDGSDEETCPSVCAFNGGNYLN